MVRVYLTTWLYQDLAGGFKRVTSPALVYLESTDYIYTPAIYYPDADQDGAPDKPRVLVLIKSESEIIELASLTGVVKITPYPFNTPSADIPDSIKSELAVLAEANGVPWSAIQGAPTYGDALKRLGGFLSVYFNGFGEFENEDFS